MAGWILVPCLVALRNELNALSPNRDKRSDGTVGDLAHQDRPSDHNPDETGETPYEDPDGRNEVHAFDGDHTGPWPAGQSMALYCSEIVRRHRLGLDDRLQNVIYNGEIASRTWGWTWRTYTGANAHREHAHFSARYTAAHENDTRPWGLTARFAPGKDFDTMDSEDRKALAGDIAAALLASTVKVGDEKWTVGACIGYMARKAYEVDGNTDGIEQLLIKLGAAVNTLTIAVNKIANPAPADATAKTPPAKATPAGVAAKATGK